MQSTTFRQPINPNKMEKIEEKKFGRIDTFVKVDEVPDGYVIWNIGRHNFEHPKCVPLCKSSLDYSVDTNTLKYIEVDSEELALRLLKEASYHGCDKKKFYEIVDEYNKIV